MNLISDIYCSSKLLNESELLFLTFFKFKLQLKIKVLELDSIAIEEQSNCLYSIDLNCLGLLLPKLLLINVSIGANGGGGYDTGPAGKIFRKLLNKNPI